MPIGSEDPLAVAQVAECPVCTRSFRPRSLSRAWRSVTEHVSARSRQGCEPHRSLHQALHRHGGRARHGCPVCPELFPSVADACLHLACSYDADHTSLRIEDERWTRAAMEQAHETREPQTPGQELYGLAKAGDAEGVQALLATGVDPNAGGEDGYTPLMTAAEAGLTEVVAALATHPDCHLNRQNTYGQSALSLAAQNNMQGAVLELLSDKASGREVETEALCGSDKLTAAELARRAGHASLADVIASKAQAQQMQTILQALSDSGNASGLFDSTSSRIAAIYASAGLPVPSHQEDDDPDDLMEWKPVCTVCMANDVDTALKPCFHACFCATCAHSILEQNGDGLGVCPICRVYVVETQHVFL